MSSDRRKEKSFANRIYPLMGHDVIQKGFALKNLPPSESTIATVTSRKEEIPRRAYALARNDSGATEALRAVMQRRFTNKDQLHGEASMPAFIGPHEAREKEERGRGLFERSEFRSPDGNRSRGREYPITSGRPFLVTSLRWERSNRTLLF